MLACLAKCSLQVDCRLCGAALHKDRAHFVVFLSIFHGLISPSLDGTDNMCCSGSSVIHGAKFC